MKASKTELNRLSNQLDELMHKYQNDILSTFIQSFSNIILIEMKEHTKALETLTATYQDLNEVATSLISKNGNDSFEENVADSPLVRSKSKSVGSLFNASSSKEYLSSEINLERPSPLDVKSDFSPYHSESSSRSVSESSISERNFNK